MTKILAFAGSTRNGSYNKLIVETAAQGARDAGAEVTVIDLADYAMPIFNQDEESEFGMPERAKAFKKLMVESDGFLIASPEYNSSYPALLKNAIDWASRKSGDQEEPPRAAFNGKVASIMATSSGAMGGMRVLVVLRMLLENLGVMVHPNQKAVPFINKKVDEEGVLVDQATIEQLHALGAQTAKLAAQVKA